MEATLQQLADLVGASVHGESGVRITGVAGVQHARPGEVALVGGKRYARFLATTKAAALVVGQDFDPSTTDLPLLITEEPVQAFEAIAARLHPPSPGPEPGTQPTAVVAGDAGVGDGASIGPYCVVEPGAVIGARTVLRPFVFVGREARIGADCVLHPHAAVLDRCLVGDRVTLHSGVVVGADGYGYQADAQGVHQKLPQHGIVEIGDDVEIGANSTVDRARYGRTVIGQGTKIDNLVMVAHNCVVGPYSLLIAQSGVAGSTTLGHHVVLAAQAGVTGHVEVGDGAIVGGQAGVTNTVPAGLAVLGSPAQDIRKERRALVAHRNLPDLVARVRDLAQTVERLAERVARLEADAADHPEAG